MASLRTEETKSHTLPPVGKGVEFPMHLKHSPKVSLIRTSAPCSSRSRVAMLILLPASSNDGSPDHGRSGDVGPDYGSSDHDQGSSDNDYGSPDHDRPGRTPDHGRSDHGSSYHGSSDRARYMALGSAMIECLD